MQFNLILLKFLFPLNKKRKVRFQASKQELSLLVLEYLGINYLENLFSCNGSHVKVGGEDIVWAPHPSRAVKDQCGCVY